MHPGSKTVEADIEHLKRKPGVDSRVALTHRAVQWMERGYTDGR